MHLVEKAKINDLREIVAMEKRCFGLDAFNQQQLKYLLTQANSSFLLTRHDKKISSYIILLMRKNSIKTRIYSLAVSPEFRGAGLAQLLISQAVMFAKALEHKELTLEVNENNEKAISLYTQQGFVVFGEKSSYYRDGSKALLMQKRIE
ncbi:MAG: GNAT family N-acetyltransferase [Bacteroidales bacterium]